MAKPYTITITNGSGTASILGGDYTVTSNTNGYNNASIDPSSVTIDKTTNTYSFNIAATGTLTMHVTEEGTVGGTPVVGATFKRCDLNGTEYGTVITTDTDGNAVFNNVPFAETNAPTIYYKQLTSDGEHEFDTALKNITLTTSTHTLEVTNTIPLTRTIQMTDTNYQGLPIVSGEITLS